MTGIQQLSVCLLAILLSSCAVIAKNEDLVISQDRKPAQVLDLQSEELANLPPAENRPVIAVYRDSFQD